MYLSNILDNKKNTKDIISVHFLLKKLNIPDGD